MQTHRREREREKERESKRDGKEYGSRRALGNDGFSGFCFSFKLLVNFSLFFFFTRPLSVCVCVCYRATEQGGRG